VRCPPIPIDSGVPAAAQSAMPSIAAATRNDRSHDFHRRCRPLMAPQLQSRIYTSLTDVTQQNEAPAESAAGGGASKSVP